MLFYKVIVMRFCEELECFPTHSRVEAVEICKDMLKHYSADYSVYILDFDSAGHLIDIEEWRC